MESRADEFPRFRSASVCKTGAPESEFIQSRRLKALQKTITYWSKTCVRSRAQEHNSVHAHAMARARSGARRVIASQHAHETGTGSKRVTCAYVAGATTSLASPYRAAGPRPDFQTCISKADRRPNGDKSSNLPAVTRPAYLCRLSHKHCWMTTSMTRGAALSTWIQRVPLRLRINISVSM